MIRHRPWEEQADFAIGLKPIPADQWFEGGDPDAARKDRLLAAHGEAAWGALPCSQSGQAEAADLVAEATGRPLGPPTPGPLYAAARLVPDDLVLVETAGPAWEVTAASLSHPAYFTARMVVGRSLGQIHDPVHGFAHRFLGRLTRIFDALPDDTVVERRNWTVVNSAETFTPDAEPVRAKIADIPLEAAGSALFTRVERQTLRRLPKTRSVLFTIRTWIDPLDALAADAEQLKAFARACRRMSADFRDYKAFARYEHLVEAFLRANGESLSAEPR